MLWLAFGISPSTRTQTNRTKATPNHHYDPWPEKRKEKWEEEKKEENHCCVFRDDERAVM